MIINPYMNSKKFKDEIEKAIKEFSVDGTHQTYI
jgi:hypothetical protein